MGIGVVSVRVGAAIAVLLSGGVVRAEDPCQGLRFPCSQLRAGITQGTACDELSRCEDRERERIQNAAKQAAELNRREQEQAANREREALEQTAAAEAEARADKVRNNPRLMSAVFGAEFCMAQAARRTALDEIAKQKKYARYGGVENQTVLYQLQTRIRLVDEFTEKERVLLRTLTNLKHVKPMPCSSQLVGGLILCKSGNQSDDCNDPMMQTVIGMVSRVDDDNEE